MGATPELGWHPFLDAWDRVRQGIAMRVVGSLVMLSTTDAETINPDPWITSTLAEAAARSSRPARVKKGRPTCLHSPAGTLVSKVARTSPFGSDEFVPFRVTFVPPAVLPAHLPAHCWICSPNSCRIHGT